MCHYIGLKEAVLAKAELQCRLPLYQAATQHRPPREHRRMSQRIAVFRHSKRSHQCFGLHDLFHFFTSLINLLGFSLGRVSRFSTARPINFPSEVCHYARSLCRCRGSLLGGVTNVRDSGTLGMDGYVYGDGAGDMPLSSWLLVLACLVCLCRPGLFAVCVCQRRRRVVVVAFLVFVFVFCFVFT